MQEVKLQGLEQIERLASKLEQSPEVFKTARRKAFEEAAPEAKKIVDRHIGGTGKVQSWQTSTVGSRGGYAAVRPKANTWTAASKKSGRRYAVGAVTNAIVSGHAFPSPSGKERYKPRIKVSSMRVPAKPFYADSEPEIQNLAQRTADKIAQELISHLEE